ncbi:OsmC family protein [Ferroacidibacillus organovorans]|uniref:Peroxiredoxin n=1 Tax=Ferroacidibacillus organovorans TaxID=1765683 RepID=A0A853K733_9BACL|nr:OsmC family protein [Ferroacidibacillus organovorans]KYP80316.1 hypothetical protein AYJ22_11795 [Ferroacidibacillus organovorans]OAG87922.1 hypothetical protein AYW79_14530 [Ferroacidibacillus organovorans]
MKTSVSWRGKRRFEAVASNGQTVVIDAKPDAGGDDVGPRPMELVLMGLCGCTGIDVSLILERMRITPLRIEITADGERAAEPPEFFTKIVMNYVVDAPDADVNKVLRAVKLSQDKYCSVAHSLRAEIVGTLVFNGQSVPW